MKRIESNSYTNNILMYENSAVGFRLPTSKSEREREKERERGNRKCAEEMEKRLREEKD